MPIAISDLRLAHLRAPRIQLYDSYESAVKDKVQTAYLCHSPLDKDLAEGLHALLFEQGWDLYMDWKDHDIPEVPTRKSADDAKERYSKLNWFVFLATPNSMSSKWCHWEIGLADTLKSHENILVIPTSDSAGQVYGEAYLSLYNQITTTPEGRLAKFNAGETSGGVPVRSLS